ncbi:MAG TPA: nucleoside-diphosphate sugar epimerase/dehydratase [Bacteroidia bacterium]|nr:nucleoside-diphosphate sugar epimerase/dehydratase [Bacteroidia bacterium]HRH07891.1 nucleoside-diphosphate sugar epimerase/dehydratase [Bacteroidia bacterium]
MLELKNNIPRWIILVIDLCICTASLVLAYLLRFNFTEPPAADKNDIPMVFAVVLVTRTIFFLASKIYAGIIRYTSTEDAKRIFINVSLGTLFFIFLNTASFIYNRVFLIPFSLVFIEMMSTIFIMISSRVLVKLLYLNQKGRLQEKINVIIYGAGEAGIIAKRTLDRDAGTKYKVLAFIDDDRNKNKKKLEGVSIYMRDELPHLLRENEVAHVIISVQNLSAAVRQEIVETCFANSTKVLTVPPITNWINGELSFKQIKKIRIEDLLGRDPIQIDLDKIKSILGSKSILVTGAAGSIGSELVRQIVKFSPSKLILLDQAESPLYDLEMELADYSKNQQAEFVIGDIRNLQRLENVFHTFTPDLVFHAAAYKHVPLMEDNPSEALLTNVLGTKNVADLAVKYKAKEFVMVSTDKAVNPTNVMGASKRIAEMYIQSLNTLSETKFITTRFGNVLGSNGSVIPRFKKQIEKGGPITITHPEITRYFMTIPEACQLVLEASATGKGGEIFIFDMGNSVKIVDLAHKMIRLSGLTLDKDIQIVYTGLRPGEKLYEELLNVKENTLKTHHSQLLIAKIAPADFTKIKQLTNELIELFDSQNNQSIVAKMKEIVPEFKSNNSVFEKLDE